MLRRQCQSSTLFAEKTIVHSQDLDEVKLGEDNASHLHYLQKRPSYIHKTWMKINAEKTMPVIHMIWDEDKCWEDTTSHIQDLDKDKWWEDPIIHNIWGEEKCREEWIDDLEYEHTL